MATLCLSNGVPMITAGDERGRTQRGNNNAYCQDNETSWVDWRPDDAWLDVYEITKTALRLRRDHPALRQRHWFEGRPTIRGGPKDLAWLHPTGREMTGDDWHDTDADDVRHVRVRRPAALPRPARRAAGRRVVRDLVQRRPRRTSPSRCPRTTGCEAGEVVLSTDPKLPVGTPVKAGDRLTLRRQSSSCSGDLTRLRSLTRARRVQRAWRPAQASRDAVASGPDRRAAARRTADSPRAAASVASVPRPRLARGHHSGSATTPSSAARRQQLVARDDPHRVAEGAGAVEDDVAVEAVAAAVVGLGQAAASSTVVSTSSSSLLILPCTTWTSTSSGARSPRDDEGAHRQRRADLGGVADAAALDVLDPDARPGGADLLLPRGELGGAGVVGVERAGVARRRARRAART